MSKVKFWVGLATALVVALLQLLGPAGTVGRVLTIVAALLGAVGVYLFPNQPAQPAVRPVADGSVRRTYRE